MQMKVYDNSYKFAASYNYLLTLVSVLGSSEYPIENLDKVDGEVE